MNETRDWLLHSPVFFMLLTLGAYRLGREAKDRSGRHALAQPVLVAIAIVGVTISVLGVDYDDYRDGTELIAFWLGPATVALAVPLHRQLYRLRGFVLPTLLTIPIGGIPPLTAALAIVAGILGAVAGPATLSLLRITDRRARGLALGAVSHGIGTSRALVEDETEGAFAGLSMGLTALATSLLLPAMIALLL